MIYWLIQSSSDHPDLVHSIAPVGLLSAAEQERLATFKTIKRRSDWLLGRWTAKHLIRAYVERQTGVRLPLAALIVDTDPDGAPHVIVDCRLQIADWEHSVQPLISNLQLSISHSGDRAFCALVEGSAVPIGADIERIEPRDWQFVEDYFTAGEMLQVRCAPAEQYETAITSIWSAKEAALKALHLGLSVDTHSVACSMAPPEQARDWTDVGFAFDRHLLELDIVPALRGWWRAVDGYVLTIATAAAMWEAAHPRLVSLFHSDREA